MASLALHRVCLSLRRSFVSACVALALPTVALADHPPRLLTAPAVEAPADLPATSAPLLELDIDAQGHISRAVVVEGVRPDVDALVLDAARAMRFEPAEQAGRPVSVRVRFRFRLQSTQASEPTVATLPALPALPEPLALPLNPYAIAPAATEIVSIRRRRRGTDQGVLVRGARPEPGAATRMTFRAEELTTVPGTFGEPTRVVATLPGVARTPFGLGFFVVRGASFENTGFFIDGYPVLILYHLAAGPAVINSRLVGQLDFYPGGYPLEYGRFSAGVISLQTLAPPAQRPRAELEVDVFRASALGVVPFAQGRGSIAIGARRSYYDLLLPLIQPGVLVSFGDAQIRLDYRVTERLRASVFAFASGDAFDRSEAVGLGATAASARDALRYDFGRVIAKLEYTTPTLTAHWSGMVGYDNTSVVQVDPGRPDRGLGAFGSVVGTRAYLRFRSPQVLTSTIGIDAIGYNYRVELATSQPAGFAAVPAPQANSRVLSLTTGVTQLGVAAWVEEILRLPRVELTAGTRVELMAYQGNQHIVADPRTVMRVRVHPRAVVIGSTGIFHQAPPVFAIVPELGAPNLLPQRAWQSSLGTELSLPAQFELRLTGFFNRQWQLPRASYEFVEGQGQGAMRARALSDGEGRAYGLEVQLRRKIERGVYGWLSYTLSRSERFIGEGRVVPFTYDQTHILNLALSWDIGNRLRLGARFQLATGAPTSLVPCNPSCGVYDADSDTYRPQYIAEADRLPTYHQLDVRADYKFMLGPLQMSAFVDVINAYYARTAESWVYQYDFRDRRPRPGLPILPTIGIRGEL
ncbi:MAG: TonB-dependent receptor [Deltaproteobacteria bacterium]|nr:TonB-dependent receptor [Deltaproteobacteria bacterium]